MWKQKYLGVSLTLFVITCFALFFLFFFQKESAKLTSELIPKEEEVVLHINKGGEDYYFKPWHNASDDVFYFVVPPSFKTEYIDFEGFETGSAFVDGIPVDGETKLNWEDLALHSLCFAGEEKTVAFGTTGGRVNTICITTDHNSRENMMLDKTYTDTGSMEIRDEEGNRIALVPMESIHTRGNSTFARSKQPFSVKLSKTVSVDGIASDKWKLLTMDFEATKLDNVTAIELATILGVKDHDRFTFSEVYFDGAYQGLYMLMDAPEPEGISESGFYVEKEIDARTEDTQENCFISGDDTFVCHLPAIPDDVKLDELSSEFSRIDQMIKAHNEEVFQYVDIRSFAQRYIVEEMTFNTDAYKTSCFFYKTNRDSLIYTDILWDYDLSLDFYYDENWKGKSVLDIVGKENRLDWWDDLLEMEVFREEVRSLLSDHMEEIVTFASEELPMWEELMKAEIPWDMALREFGKYQYYRLYDSNYRYLSYVLGERIRYITEAFDVPCKELELPWNDESHSVEFWADGSLYYEMNVKDGTMLDPGMIPLPEGYSTWKLRHDTKSFWYGRPILEDIIFDAE